MQSPPPSNVSPGFPSRAVREVTNGCGGEHRRAIVQSWVQISALPLGQISCYLSLHCFLPYKRRRGRKPICSKDPTCTQPARCRAGLSRCSHTVANYPSTRAKAGRVIALLKDVGVVRGRAGTEPLNCPVVNSPLKRCPPPTCPARIPPTSVLKKLPVSQGGQKQLTGGCNLGGVKAPAERCKGRALGDPRRGRSHCEGEGGTR